MSYLLKYHSGHEYPAYTTDIYLCTSLTTCLSLLPQNNYEVRHLERLSVLHCLKFTAKLNLAIKY